MPTTPASAIDASNSNHPNSSDLDDNQQRQDTVRAEDTSAFSSSAIATVSAQANSFSGRAAYKPARQRPLIEQVTNEWRKSPHYTRYQNDDYEEDEYGQLLVTNRKSSGWSLSRPSSYPRTFRYLALYVLFLLGCLYYWRSSWASSTTSSTMSDEDILDASMYKASVPGRQFGTNARPEFTDLKQIGYMESEYVPGASSASRKRLVAVGDVHGCKKELTELLEKISFNEKHDHLLLTGDIVFKGPDSGGVIDLARSIKASCVRGNHDDRTILAYNSIHKKSAAASSAAAADSKIQVVPAPSSGSTSTNPNLGAARSDDKHLALAKQLNPHQMKWLQSCPCILNIGPLGRQRDYVVVHAGLAPGIRLEKQDPWHVMNMRSIDLATRVPSEDRLAGENWATVWNHYQRHLASGMQRKTVIYGHDSRTGLNIQKYSRGLDTGCVNGGELTALVIDARGKEKLVSVKCKNYREKNTE